MLYQDAMSPGQVAAHWQKPSFFVDRMIAEGKLVVDERNLITTEALGNFYKAHGTDLD